uniref:Uncharacterized protein n=1 Tax=Oryza meridionalis TaxID=40149 RepID=A0A0E0E233_9ORYZ
MAAKQSSQDGPHASATNNQNPTGQTRQEEGQRANPPHTSSTRLGAASRPLPVAYSIPIPFTPLSKLRIFPSFPKITTTTFLLFSFFFLFAPAPRVVPRDSPHAAPRTEPSRSLSLSLLAAHCRRRRRSQIPSGLRCFSHRRRRRLELRFLGFWDPCAAAAAALVGSPRRFL